MKPDWDKLMAFWNKGEKAEYSLIADVDCTGAGKSICDEHGVRGFPSLKWGDPNGDLEKYEGGRTFSAMKVFAENNLEAPCSPANTQFCDDEEKKKIADLQAIPVDELRKKIAEKKKQMEDAEKNFEKETKRLQEEYAQLEKDKLEKIAEVKESTGLRLRMAVQKDAEKVKASQPKGPMSLFERAQQVFGSGAKRLTDEEVRDQLRKLLEEPGDQEQL